MKWLTILRKIYKPDQEKGEDSNIKIRNERSNITTEKKKDCKKIVWITVNKSGNLNEMDWFLKRHKLPQLTRKSE